ncbi:heavy metal transporter [Mycobacterium sp. ST-F2]|uniref:heavy-metal-associated domain-containing protein n=1 Tax=Mycobacterium sp. ST-F2 TaxID=1490484 RepID=UPI00093D4D48|nr:heavy metal-associated domain-containing protein [Mycobacterium sp. ST-F2]OKH80774.1 heavy metal transporter [Mycobacterium sp. ST-F2]
MATTHVFSVSGMHCASCSLLIDDALEDLPGVQDAHTDLKANRATVQLDTTLTTAQQVIDTITNLGYTATPQP